MEEWIIPLIKDLGLPAAVAIALLVLYSSKIESIKITLNDIKVQLTATSDRLTGLQTTLTNLIDDVKEIKAACSRSKKE